MDKKRKILRIAIFVFMALSLSLTTSQTLAYWASSTNVTNDTATATATTGTWNQPFEWDPNGVYFVGDLVTYQGVEYRCLKDHSNGKVPGANGSQSFWEVA